jgi:diguanylate cyclase (GGDEF)-like protein
VKFTSVGNVVLKIALIISISQLVILLVLGNTPHTMSGNTVEFTPLAFLAFLNMSFRVLTTSPISYLWIINPFVKARDDALLQITHLAHYDQLTNLGNRRLIYQNLEKIKARCDRRKIFGAILLIDLNKFKPINDEYGHDAGDAILISVAEQLTKSIRSEDVVGRFGGDEFVVLISHLDNDEEVSKSKILTIVQKLQSAINTAIEFEGIELRVSSSIGICFFKENNSSNDELIKRADIAMYKAKKTDEKVAVY